MAVEPPRESDGDTPVTGRGQVDPVIREPGGVHVVGILQYLLSLRLVVRRLFTVSEA